MNLQASWPGEWHANPHSPPGARIELLTSSIRQSVNPSIRQYVNPSIRQPLNPSTPQSLNPSTPQSLDPSIPQPHNPKSNPNPNFLTPDFDLRPNLNPNSVPFSSHAEGMVAGALLSVRDPWAWQKSRVESHKAYKHGKVSSYAVRPESNPTTRV